MRTTSLAAALLIAAAGTATAQQNEIKWTQTTNMPKGQNMPRDRADILGIELGDTYEEAKAKLQKLAAEGIQPKTKTMTPAERAVARMNGERSGPPPMREEQRIYRLKAPGANSSISVSYVQNIQMTRELPTANGKMGETVSMNFSAPSSGHQVLGISRSITYYDQRDQPLISETLAQLKQKMKSDPQSINAGTPKYRFQFNDGKPFTQVNPTLVSCIPRTDVSDTIYLKTINETGDCDALMEVNAQTGVSRDHASILSFTLADNDRAKANLTADFAFINDYAKNLQQNTRGAPPKL